MSITRDLLEKKRGGGGTTSLSAPSPQTNGSSVTRRMLENKGLSAPDLSAPANAASKAALQALRERPAAKTTADDGYASLRGAEDFAEKSQYRTTANGREAKLNYFTGKYTETGFDDILYDAINGNETARSHLLNTDTGRSYDLDALTADDVQMFDYLYATEGAEKAYDYLDYAAGRTYTGAEAAALGALQGTGVTSMSAAIGAGVSKLTGDKEAAERNSKWYNELTGEAAAAREQHPASYGAGSVGGNLALMYGIGGGLGAAEGALAKGVQIGGKTVAAQLSPAVQGIVNGALTFAASDAIHNAGAAATGQITGTDLLKSVGISGVQGAAGGAAGNLVGSGLAGVLRKSGLQTPFMEFLRQTAQGFASAGANIGTGYALSEEKPTKEQVTTDLATAFLLSVLQSGISTYRTTTATRAQLEQAVEAVGEQYGRMSQGWESMTPEARAQTAENILRQTQDLRAELNGTYLAGQQTTVDQMNAALDGIEEAMQAYVSGFSAAQAATQSGPSIGGAAAAGASPAPGETAGEIVPVTQFTAREAEPEASPLPAGAAAAMGRTAQDPFAAEVRRQMLGQMETASTGETETGLIPISEQMQESLSTGKNNIIAKTFNDIVSFVKNARSKKGGSERLYMGTMPESASAFVKSSTGVDVTGYTAILPGSSVQHIFNRHGNVQTEAARGQQAVTAEDIALIPQVLSTPDSVTLSEEADAMGRPVLLFSKQIGGTYITAQAVTDGRKALTTNTLWIQKKKNPLVTTSDADVSADPAHNVQNVPPSGSSAPTVPQGGGEVNYAEALQRAGAGAETAEMAAYFLERAAQGMELTADQTAFITAVPGGETLLEQLQAVREGFPGREGLGPKETENGGQRAAEPPAGAKIAADAAELMDGGMNRGEYAKIAGGEPSAAVQGDAISDGGQGRFPGAGTGEQAGELAAGPARAVPPAEQGRTAVGRQNRGKHLRATKVSSMELGLANGTETPSVSLVAEADWDEGLRATAERVRQETGLPVTYVLGSIPVRDAGGVVRNVRGVYTADQIILQADNLRVTTDQIADHEIFHDKAFQTPGLVRDVELRIMEQFTPEEFAGVVQTYVEKLRGVVDVPANATPDEIDEALAVIKEEIMADAYAGINAFSAHAERFQGAVEETLEEKGIGRETAAATDRTTGPPDRYSYGGKNANRADSESRREAETLEMQGVDQETIREQTGWFRGADGKWRFEIDDSGMVYHDRSGGVPGQTLADYLTHDELFANYPQLRKTKLEFAELGRGIQGQYDAGTDTITLNEALRDAPEGTLIHEIQHAIQRAEGFARGANDKFWSRQLESGYDGRTQEQRRETQRLRQEYNSIREQDPAFFRDMLELSALVPDMPRGKVDFDTLEQIEEDPPEWQRYDEARAAMEEKYSETRIWDFDDLLYRLKQAELTPGRTGTELYYDTAGEIEARDAARRRTLTAEERRVRRPDIGNEDTVFAEDTEDWMGELDAEYGPQLQGDLAAAEPDTQGSIEQVAAMKPVASITGEEFRKGETDLISQVEQFFNEQGNRANNPYLGEVILDRRGIKSDIGHGIGRKKAAAFAAVPDVIAQGQVVDYRKNWKGRGYDTAVIAAPIEIGGQPYLAGVVLTKSNLTNRFYLHEVLTENDGATPFKTGAQMGEPGGDTPSVISILEEIRAVKHGTDHSGQGSAIQAKDNQGRELTAQQAEYFRDSQARDSQGRLLTLYHQTGAAFTVFEPRHQGAGTRDSGTPFGIFLKPTAKDIGLKGKTVMELYANITNPLYASNREALNYSLIKLSDEYEAIKAEIDALDATYHEKFEQAKQKSRDFMTEWRKKNPDASRRALYDVPEFNRLYDAEDSVIDEWEAKADELSLRAKEAITSALQEAGYDGVHLQEDAGSFGRSVETWIALEPSQVKNVTNTTPTSSPDIRFSVDESPDTAEQEDREQPAAAEGKKRRQRAKKPVAESLPIIAKRDLKSNLLNLFSIPAGQKVELGGIIDQYAERLLKNGELTQADRDAFFDRMYAAGVMTMPADEYYATGREAVKGGKVYVTESEKHEFGDDWNEFRKRAFANGIYLTSSREDRGVDQWNMELAETLPGLFDAGELDSRSVLERIVQVAEEGKDQKLSLAEYAAELAGQEYISEDEILDNMERQMDWALRTFAEKAQLEIHLRDRTGVKIAQEREKFSEATKQQRERDMVRRAEERAERKAMQQRQREHRELRELQERTLKQLQWLSKNRWRAPEELRAAFDEVLGDIDIYAIGAANEMNWSRKYEATWKDLAQLYKTARETDPNFLPSKELEKIVARLDGDKIADLDVDALQDLYRAAVGLRTEFYNRNNVVGDELNRLFEEVYADSKREIETAAGGYKGKGLDKFLNLEQLTPMNVLERMGGWTPDGTFYSMAKQLEEGERSVRDYTVRAKRRLESFLTEHEDWVKKADGQGKDAVWYELEVPELLELGMGDKPIFGKTITVYMTPAQKVHLYLESKNYDNLRHMTGGRTFANRELYSQGKRQEALAQGTTIRLAPETVKKIVSDLTDEEMELAQVLEKYYNDFAKGEINRVANILYGYDKAQSRDYAPIFTNQNYTKSEIGIFDTTAEGVGHLKARQFSKNPSYNISAFDAFERHVDQTARFVGMSIPARNWQTLLNWREKNNSMGDVITHKWGEEGKKYIEDLLNELQGGSITKRSSAERLMDTALSNYISSVFGFNPSIVFKQAMSFPLAGTYLGWENIPNIAAALRTDDGLINTYTSELAYRLMGYATPETAQLKNNPSAVSENKVLKFTFGGGAITAMDGWTVKTIWRWAENKVRRDMPELETGTAEQIAAGQSPFYQEVAKSFEEAVSRSQPMYDVMHRAEIMRNSSKAVRAITLFKTVPIQQYNMLRQTVGEAQQAKRDFEAGKSTEEDFRAARGKAGRAVLSVILAAVGIEAINFLAAMLKNKGKQYRDEDGDLTWESAGQQFLQGFVQDNAGMIAGGDLVAELLGSIVTGDRWYGIDTPGVTQIAEVAEQIVSAAGEIGTLVQDAYDILSNGGDLGEYFRRHGADYLGYLNDALETVAAYFGGIAAGNVKAYVLGALRWISPEFTTAYEDALSTADKAGLAGLTGGALETRVGDILHNRLGETAEGTAAELAALYEAGYKKAVPTDTPASVTVNGEDQKLSAYQQQTYDAVWRESVAGALDELLSQDWYTALDSGSREKVLAKLYDYGAQNAKAALFDEFEADSFVEKIRDFHAAGLSTVDYLEAWRKSAEIDDSGANASGRATEFAYWADTQGYTARQAEVVKNSFTVFSHLPVEPERYTKLQAAGLSDGEAKELTEALAALEPLDGAASVSDMQRLRTIAAAGLDTETMKAAMGTILGTAMTTESGGKSQYALMLEALDAGYTVDEWLELKEAGYMTESAFDKVRISGRYDISPAQYIRYRELLLTADALNEDPDKRNGSVDQDETAAAINGMLGLTDEQKAVLWQLQNKSWKANKNPFDSAVGQTVYDYLHEEELPSLTDGGLPSLSLLSLGD